MQGHSKVIILVHSHVLRLGIGYPHILEIVLLQETLLTQGTLQEQEYQVIPVIQQMCLLGIGYPHILGIRLGIEYPHILEFLQEVEYPHILGIRLGIEYRLIQGFLQEHRLDNTLEHLQECLLETIKGLS